MARIGIKLADGSFYPILEDETRQKKRLILTAARDGQTSAQIDLLRRDEQSEHYVGCLVLEDLPAEGSTELELVVGLDENGTVEARVSDSSGTRYQSLSVNLDTFTVTESFSLPDEDGDTADSALGDITGVDSLEEIGLPDFDDEDTRLPSTDDIPSDAIHDSTDSIESFVDEPLPAEDGEEMDADEEEPEPAPRPFSPLILAAVLLIGLSVAVIGAFFVFRWLQTEPLPELRAALLIPMTCRRRPGCTRPT
ncbi:MAG: hypothetical protein ACOCYB_08760 [Alkalispirochaeta sp.]